MQLTPRHDILLRQVNLKPLASPQSMLASAFREFTGVRLVDDDGESCVLEFLPPATPDEIAKLEAELPSPLPVEIREALQLSKGFLNGPLESFSLLDYGQFGMDDVFPYAHSIGHDGFGNYWVLDLLPDSTSWGPVFFACHDPPVIAYQCETVEQFFRDVVAMWQPGAPRSPVDEVHDDFVNRIWNTNPGVTSQVEASASRDAVLAGFASGFPANAVFVDLRSPSPGQGFSWGRYGPRTTWVRHGHERLWATIPPTKPPSLLSRFFHGAS